MLSVSARTSAPVVIPQQCPNATRSNRASESNIVSHPLGNTYALESSVALHDPTMVNTPPSEFMNNLKERMNTYFTGPDR